MISHYHPNIVFFAHGCSDVRSIGSLHMEVVQAEGAARPSACRKEWLLQYIKNQVAASIYKPVLRFAESGSSAGK